VCLDRVQGLSNQESGSSAFAFSLTIDGYGRRENSPNYSRAKIKRKGAFPT